MLAQGLVPLTLLSARTRAPPVMDAPVHMSLCTVYVKGRHIGFLSFNPSCGMCKSSFHREQHEKEATNLPHTVAICHDRHFRVLSP